MAIAFPFTLQNGPGHLADASQVMANLETLRAALEAGGFGASSVLSSVIATEETRESTFYGLMPTPDEVTILMPENGLIAIACQATWKESVAGAASAAIFLNGNAVKIAAAESTLEQTAKLGGTANKFAPLASSTEGLVSGAASGGYAGDATTGQIVGTVNLPTAGVPSSGACFVFAAAGTYKVCLRFKSTSGKVTVKSRKLWAWIA